MSTRDLSESELRYVREGVDEHVAQLSSLSPYSAGERLRRKTASLTLAKLREEREKIDAKIAELEGLA